MRKIVASSFTSLDGVADADSDWQYPYFDEELFAGITAGWAAAGALLLGRRTWEGYERLRVEHPDSPMLAFLDATPVHVVSSTPTGASRENVTVVAAEPERVRELGRGGAGDLLVLGSPTLVRWLLAERLLDELRLTVLPVVVGAGPTLLGGGPASRVPLRLTTSEALGSGAVVLHYAADHA
jgi:dihydrofolate reductase